MLIALLSCNTCPKGGRYGSGILSAEASSQASVNQINRYWTDANEIVENLDNYQALWVKYHGCVWSECDRGEYFDDDGENHDGDENWYMTRTQQFCANAAYSLYGIKKNHVSIPFLACTRPDYIDTFFTYGGADVFLEAVGKNPRIYADDDSTITYGSSSSNSACRYTSDDDGSSHSVTMGCTPRGRFGMAKFEDIYCDGNEFEEIINPMRSYNRQIKTRCHMVYGSADWLSGDKQAAVTALLESSWSCDVELYPKSCPDPYRKKRQASAALRAAANGFSPTLAYFNARLKLPMTIASWMMICFGLLLMVMAYRILNKERIRENGGGLRGLAICFRQDFKNYAQRKRQEYVHFRKRKQEEYLAFRERRREQRRERRRRKRGKSAEMGDSPVSGSDRRWGSPQKSRTRKSRKDKKKRGRTSEKH